MESLGIINKGEYTIIASGDGQSERYKAMMSAMIPTISMARHGGWVLIYELDPLIGNLQELMIRVDAGLDYGQDDTENDDTSDVVQHAIDDLSTMHLCGPVNDYDHPKHINQIRDFMYTLRFEPELLVIGGLDQLESNDTENVTAINDIIESTGASVLSVINGKDNGRSVLDAHPMLYDLSTISAVEVNENTVDVVKTPTGKQGLITL